MQNRHLGQTGAGLLLVGHIACHPHGWDRQCVASMAQQGIDQHQSMRLPIAQMKVANDGIRPARFSQFKACRIDSAVLSS